MSPALSSFLWVALALPVLVLLQRWIHRHLRGVALLLTGRPDWSLWLYALILLPGVFLHELSHWLTAGLLGVRTGRFSLMPRDHADGVQLGYVEYYRDRRLGPIRESLIGAAPLIFGSTAVILIGNHIFDLPAILALVQEPAVGNWVAAARLVVAADDSLVWLYLLFAVSNAMLPSASDRRAWPGFGLALAAVVGLLYALDLTPLLIDGLLGPVARLFGYLGLALGVTIALDLLVMVLIAVVEALLGRLRGRRVVYNG